MTSKQKLIKETKERLVGCTCATCKFFYYSISNLRNIFNMSQDHGVCAEKHKDWFDYFMTQASASDSDSDYCWKYVRREGV